MQELKHEGEEQAPAALDLSAGQEVGHQDRQRILAAVQQAAAAQEQDDRRLARQRILEAAKQAAAQEVALVRNADALTPLLRFAREVNLAQGLGHTWADSVRGIGNIQQDIAQHSLDASQLSRGLRGAFDDAQHMLAESGLDRLTMQADLAAFMRQNMARQEAVRKEIEEAFLAATQSQRLVLGTWPTQPAPRRSPTPAAPAQPPAEPKAAEAISTAHLPGGNLEEAIVLAVTSGEVLKARLIKLLMSLPDQPAPGCTPPDWQDIQAVALLYKERGHDCTSQQGFIQRYLEPRGYVMDIRTFQRWISDYEMLTGEKLRPGRGRRKRPQPKRRSM